MLTGIEIAGLALAIVPLLDSAASVKCSSISPIFRQKAKDNKLADLYHRLHAQLSLLSVCLRNLIKHLPTLTEVQKARLLQFENEPWKDEDVAKALQQKLGDGHKDFLDNLDAILVALDSIISNSVLKLDRDDVLVGRTVLWSCARRH